MHLQRLHRVGLPVVAVASLIASSCSAPVASLIVTGPSTVTAGVPFTVTVTAVVNGERDTAMDGPIHFTTSDPNATFPTLYVFTAADAGQHTFGGAITLNTPGNQTLTASDYIAPVITGTTDITVVLAGADTLSPVSKPEDSANPVSSRETPDQFPARND